MIYTYHCIDSDGRAQQGRLEAATQADATSMLEAKGWKVLLVQSVGVGRASLASPKRGSLEGVVFDDSSGVGEFLADRFLRRDRAGRQPLDDSWMQKVRCPELVVVLFTRQLATLLAGGFPLVRALDTLSFQADHPNFGEVITHVATQIETGHSFSASLAKFPRVFSKVYVSMVRIGERTGQLDDVLDRLASWREQDHDLYQRVKGALTYPCFVLAISVILGLIIFYTILPGFVNILDRMDVELPLVTRIVFAVTNAVKNPGAWLVFIATTVVLGLKINDLYKTPRGAVWIYNVLCAVPMLGTMLRFAGVSRYCSALGALLESGVELVRALKLAAQASGSPALAMDANHLLDSVEAGELVSSYMEGKPDLYPNTVVQLVKVGEEASDLPDMLRRAANYYADEVRYRIESLSAALEPIMIVCVGVVVGTVVLSIFAPMYGYLAKLGG